MSGLSQGQGVGLLGLLLLLWEPCQPSPHPRLGPVKELGLNSDTAGSLGPATWQPFPRWKQGTSEEEAVVEGLGYIPGGGCYLDWDCHVTPQLHGFKLLGLHMKNRMLLWMSSAHHV